MSSARVVRCWVKSRNERNPYGQLLRKRTLARLQGYKVSSHYDSMIAKVIVHGSNRLEAIRRMRRVLAELVIDGIDTNQELQYLILHTGEYVKGNFDTSFIENNLDKLVG